MKLNLVSCLFLLSMLFFQLHNISPSLMARISSDWQKLEPAHDFDLATLTVRQNGHENRGGLGQLFFGRKPELHTRLQTLTNVPQPCSFIPGRLWESRLGLTHEWQQELSFLGAIQNISIILKTSQNLTAGWKLFMTISSITWRPIGAGCMLPHAHNMHILFVGGTEDRKFNGIISSVFTAHTDNGNGNHTCSITHKYCFFKNPFKCTLAK